MARSKILVTGGAGFIGSNLVDKLIEEDYEVVVVDNLTTGKKDNLNPKATFYHEDIRMPILSQIFQKEQPDYVSHHAAQIDVRKSVEDPMNDLDINGIGFLNVMECSRKNNVKKVVSISSGGVVYGEPEEIPIPETAKKNPLSPYGITKHLSELYMNYYRKIHNMNCVALRYSNVYGPRQDSKGEAGVIDIFARAMLNNEQCKIFGDGEQLRDYIFISDVVNANIQTLKYGMNEAFNIGTGNPTSVNQLFKTLKTQLNYLHDPQYLPARPGELRVNCLDISKAEHLLAWEPKVSLQEGIKKTVEWIIQNKVDTH